MGAAAVKELYKGADLVGYAVERHIGAGADGKSWYWYERTADGVVADGNGDAGAPKTICVACHSAAGSDATHSGHDFVYTQVKAGDAQTPPQGTVAVEAWLAAGDYKMWACEGSAHPQRSPSPHGNNRICSNALTSAATAGEYPIGAASVKELTDATGKVTGYAVSSHINKGTDGTNWYWYERNADGVVADGYGDAGPWVPGPTPGIPVMTLSIPRSRQPKLKHLPKAR